jgi:preprotein translocase subunit SecD
MRWFACALAVLVVVGTFVTGRAQDSPTRLADGVYAVLREGLQEKDVLPLARGEALLVNRHRYAKKDDKEPPRYLVVRATADVDLDLVGEPKSIKNRDDVTGILLQLQPKAAIALERLTSNAQGRPIAIVIGGDVVSSHKVREAIKGGQVQITCCDKDVASYLLDQLQKRQKNK